MAREALSDLRFTGAYRVPFQLSGHVRQHLAVGSFVQSAAGVTVTDLDGMRTGEDLAAHYGSGDLFFFPNTTETFGNVTLEAMANGLPVLAFDYAAARLLISPGVNGVLARYDDARDLTLRAAQLAKDPAALRDMGRHARETAGAMGWDRIVERLRGAAGAAGSAWRGRLRRGPGVVGPAAGPIAVDAPVAHRLDGQLERLVVDCVQARQRELLLLPHRVEQAIELARRRGRGPQSRVFLELLDGEHGI